MKQLPQQSQKNRNGLKQTLLASWQLYAMLLLPIVFLLLFKYYPIAISHIAFKKYTVMDGIWQSPWVGLDHFIRFFHSYEFSYVMKNTILINLYYLLAGFPFPIILALGLNYCRKRRIRKTVQMVTYAPYFISTVVLVGIIQQMFALRTGVVNHVLENVTGHEIDFLGSPDHFYGLFVWSDIWKITGYNSIVYLAALSAVDTQQHEAAIIDGASCFQRVFYVDLPAIMPTCVLLFTLQAGRILNVGFEKALLLQNPSNIMASEVLSTYVYNVGIASASINYSYPTAVGLFASVINLGVILLINGIVKLTGGESLM